MTSEDKLEPHALQHARHGACGIDRTSLPKRPVKNEVVAIMLHGMLIRSMAPLDRKCFPDKV